MGHDKVVGGGAGERALHGSVVDDMNMPNLCQARFLFFLALSEIQRVSQGKGNGIAGNLGLFLVPCLGYSG